METISYAEWDQLVAQAIRDAKAEARAKGLRRHQPIVTRKLGELARRYSVERVQA